MQITRNLHTFPPCFTVRAAVVGCDDVDDFINRYRSHHHPLPPAALSPQFTLIDLGARAAAAAAKTCKPGAPSHSCIISQSEIEFGFYDETQEFWDMSVLCQAKGGGLVEAEAKGDVFAGIVILQLLSLAASADHRADDDEAFVSDVIVAAGDLGMSAALGLTTALAGA